MVSAIHQMMVSVSVDQLVRFSVSWVLAWLVSLFLVGLFFSCGLSGASHLLVGLFFSCAPSGASHLFFFSLSAVDARDADALNAAVDADALDFK